MIQYIKIQYYYCLLVTISYFCRTCLFKAIKLVCKANHLKRVKMFESILFECNIYIYS